MKDIGREFLEKSMYIGPVPVSMQPFFVFVAGFALGPRRGTLAMGLYLWQTGDRATVLGRDDGTVFIDVP